MPIYPAILTESSAQLQEQLDLAKQMPDLAAVQLDLIDGQFADAQTVSLQTMVEADHGDLALDFHLMVDEPMDTVWEMIEWQQHMQVRTVIAQIERMSHPADYIAEVKKQGWRVGLALDIYTPWDEEEIDPAWLIDIDMIQLMGGVAGKQGQSLHPEIFSKLKAVQQTLAEFYTTPAAKAAALKAPIEVAVDIGVKLSTAPQLIAAGVTGLAVGSGIWQAADPVTAYVELTELLPDV